MENIDLKEGQTNSKAESILAAAKRSFLTAGFGAVSMDTIAREAGVSKATVYAHFAGKEELFGAVIDRECERYFARFSAGELDPCDVRASLTVLGRRFLELLLSPDGIALYRIILGEVREQQRFFDQALAGRTDLLGRRAGVDGEAIGEVLPTRWIE